MVTSWWKAIQQYKEGAEEEKKEKDLGPGIALGNRFIRKMLTLAQASENDVFYDLGCGLGQLLVIAIQSGVKRAVGIEKDQERFAKAAQYIRSLNLPDRIEIIKGNYEAKRINLSDATLVYNGLNEVDNDLDIYRDKLSKGCKLITLALPLVGVIPNTQDFPFYLMKLPFRKTRKFSEWVFHVLGKQATREEFIVELDYDPDFDTDIPSLERIMQERFVDL